MSPAVRPYSPKYILPLLHKTLFATLCTFHQREINSRVMIFANDPRLSTVYFVSHQTTDKIGEIARNPAATACILSTGDKLDDYSETSIRGRISLHREFNDPQAQVGLALLAAKSAMIQALLDGGSLGEYIVLKLDVEELAFRVYRDIIQNVPKTILRPNHDGERPAV